MTTLARLSPFALLRKGITARRLRNDPNQRGVAAYPPGHFYSPLLDISRMGPDDQSLEHDGVDYWEHIDLRETGQRRFYTELLETFPPDFPARPSALSRYHSENTWFAAADAFALAGVIQRERPERIIEVGSGFSSAVMLDTLDKMKRPTTLIFIEPNPERLYGLLTESDRVRASIQVKPVQDVPLPVFDQLEARDVLFIDSSHVAKIGSDVTHLLLRVLPRLKPGVIVHFHDIFYPHAYPAAWTRSGRAWNEALFLRAFLIGNRQFQILAFNSFAARMLPDVFRDRFPALLENSGSSFWLQKTA